ncbi:MAG TPA: hypothetical protein VF303_01500 [Candidatus Nanoarchaeia archaeon]
MRYLPTAKLIFFASFLGFLLVSAATANLTAAQDTTNATTKNIGIQISAPIYNFGIDPGGSAQEIIKVKNVSNSTQTFYPEVFDFRPIGETGAPEFILNSDQEDRYTYSLASWVQISKAGITLKSNESTALNFTINVPKDAEPGGRYAGILFGTSPPKPQGTQIAISNKVGSLILVRISGDAKELANLKEFSTPSNFYENPPVDFLVRVENKGNVHFKPKGTIEVKDTFGRKVATLDVNEKNGNVLPESIRRFDKSSDGLTWKPSGFTVGRYTANVLLTYGDSGKQINGSTTFWVLPWKILLVVGLGVIILILLLILLLKKYNRWVVSRAKKTEKPSPQAVRLSSPSKPQTEGEEEGEEKVEPPTLGVSEPENPDKEPPAQPPSGG